MEPEYDADERRYQGDEEAESGPEDEWGQSTGWKKKGKKKRKGSRRGLRAKKRSL